MSEAMRPKTEFEPAQEGYVAAARDSFSTPARPADLDDGALLELVQRQTFRYFWDFAHPVSGLARERSNETPRHGLEVVTTGGSGFGVMAISSPCEELDRPGRGRRSTAPDGEIPGARRTAITASSLTGYTARPAGRSRSAARTTAAISWRPPF